MQVILPGGSTSHGAEPGALNRGLLMVACGGCSLRAHTRGPEPYPVCMVFDGLWEGQGNPV